MKVICDVETNRLVNPDILWIIVCRDIDNPKNVRRFLRPDLNPKEFLEFASSVTLWVGHNLIKFDLLTAMCKLIKGFKLPPVEQIVDTLILSRLVNYKLTGGHSLDNWGKILKCPKIKFSEFDRYSEEMAVYCEGDTETNLLIYKTLERHLLRFHESLMIEQLTAIYMQEAETTGFYFNIEKAKRLHKLICFRLEKLTEILQRDFPPRSKLIKEITPVKTKHGTLSQIHFKWETTGDLTPYSEGATFSRFEWEYFNPGSSKQKVERLNELGWKPIEKTKGHIQCIKDLMMAKRKKDNLKVKELEEKLKYFEVYGWTTSETNLETIPKDSPESTKRLLTYTILDSRRSTLEEWFNAFNENTHRIHGNFNTIGAWSGRMSHSGPNMANIPSPKSRLGSLMRTYWTTQPDRILVGVDADGIQLRVLAHYMEDEAFINGLVSGSKHDGTDVHSLNRRALGLNICKTRDHAKTFIYAWLLGASRPKVADILSCSLSEAKQASDSFLSAYPGLKKLKTRTIPTDATNGYFLGLDGRAVICYDEHLMLAGYLQNGEAVIMKKALSIWYPKLVKEKIPFWFVNFVHDEWVTETIDDVDTARYIQKIQEDSIKQAGEELGVKCPLLGSGSIGKTWLDIH